MDHKDHVYLLRRGITGSGGIWADFGSGWGAFTLALAELIGPEGELYSIDRDRQALNRQRQNLSTRFPEMTTHYLEADISQPLQLPPLDGLVIANALHFFRDKDRVVRLLKSYLRSGGRFIVVEYNTDRGNRWVPYPLSLEAWSALAGRIGFTQTEKLASVPSSFLGEIYSAAGW